MTEEQLIELPSQIERGVLFLDTLFEGRSWLPQINLETLDMMFLNKDIMAQVSGLEDIGYSEYFAMLEMMKLNHEAQYECGFNLKDGDSSDYAMLTQLWKDKISGLRQEST